MKVFNVNYDVFTKKDCKSKFALIGDLHGWINNKQIAKVIENIKNSNPDVVLLAGDIMAESYQWTKQDRIAYAQKLLRSLTETGADVVTVLGNHDTHVLTGELMYNYMSLEAIPGVHPLFNSSVDLNKNGENIHVAGLVTDAIDGVTAATNAIVRHKGIDERPQRIVKTLEPLLDLNPQQFNILLAHDPRQLRMPKVDEATKDFDMRVAAHIHNGYLPFKKTTKDEKYLDQDWAHYLFFGIPSLKSRNFARGVAYGNTELYVLCTQTGDYYLVKFNQEKNDNEYKKITEKEALTIIKEYKLTPSVITGGVNRYVGVPYEGSEVTHINIRKR